MPEEESEDISGENNHGHTNQQAKNPRKAEAAPDRGVFIESREGTGCGAETKACKEGLAGGNSRADFFRDPKLARDQPGECPSSGPYFSSGKAQTITVVTPVGGVTRRKQAPKLLSSPLHFCLAVTQAAVKRVFAGAFRVLRDHFFDSLAWRIRLFAICGHVLYSYPRGKTLLENRMHKGRQTNMCIIHQMRNTATKPRTTWAIQSPALFGLPRLNTHKW